MYIRYMQTYIILYEGLEYLDFGILEGSGTKFCRIPRDKRTLYIALTGCVCWVGGVDCQEASRQGSIR
jgi:hypothetical protein